MDKWPKTVESLSDGLMSLRCNFHTSPFHTKIANWEYKTEILGWRMGESVIRALPLLENKPSAPNASEMASYTFGLLNVVRPFNTCSAHSASWIKIYKFGPIHTRTGLWYFLLIPSKYVEFSIQWKLWWNHKESGQHNNNNKKIQAVNWWIYKPSSFHIPKIFPIIGM